MNGERNEQSLTISQLAQLLQDEVENVRLKAVDDLGKSQSIEAIPHLGNVLNDESETVPVRQHAAMALGGISHPEAIPHLGHALSGDEDPSVRRLCVGALERIGLIEAIPYLLKAVEDPDDLVGQSAVYALRTAIGYLSNVLKDENAEGYGQALDTLKEIGLEFLGKTLLDEDRDPVREGTATALGKLNYVNAIEYLGQALTADESDAVRQAAATALGEIGDPGAVPLLRTALARDENVGVLWNAISALRRIGGAEAIPALGETLGSDENETVRQRAAGALGQMGLAEAIPYLCRALIRDRSETARQAAGSALTKITGWRAKAGQMIRVLQEGKRERAGLDALAIIRAVQLPERELVQSEHLLTDYLIERAVAFNADHRMTAVMAALIIASADGSTSLAGERLNAYQQAREIPEDQLRMLRIEIGGATALNPVLEVLQHNLAENFQKPIAILNEDTRKMWTTTILFAQVGFLARTIMSIAVFVLGVYLVLGSYLKVMSGNLQAEQLVGSGVSFGSGIITMLLMVYRGPLKEIRQSVSDLGVASAAFIAYVHRVLEISHTFSFYYLEQKITFAEMERSSRLIEEAMNGTIRILGGKDGQLAQLALNQRVGESANQQIGK